MKRRVASGTNSALRAGRDGKLKQTFACLYGLTSFEGLSQQELIPRIPDDVVSSGVVSPGTADSTAAWSGRSSGRTGSRKPG